MVWCDGLVGLVKPLTREVFDFTLCEIEMFGVAY